MFKEHGQKAYCSKDSLFVRVFFHLRSTSEGFVLCKKSFTWKTFGRAVLLLKSIIFNSIIRIKKAGGGILIVQKAFPLFHLLMLSSLLSCENK